jgi:hypothetical protein
MLTILAIIIWVDKVMSEEKTILWQMNNNLEEISAKLDKLVSLFEISRKQELEEFKKKKLGKSQIKKQVYELCDGTRTVNDIARFVDKSIQHISIILSDLEKAGLVVSKTVGRRKYYIRTF